MPAKEILKASERSALKNATGGTTGVAGSQVVSRVVGKVSEKNKKRGGLGAVGLMTIVLVALGLLISSGTLIPAAIMERLVEATDVQYADAVESKFLVFQQALAEGGVPANTVERLKANGIVIEGANLIYNGETIAAGEFINKIHADAGLYAAFNAATYDRAAYYYDEAAEEVFRKIGSTRNNYTSSSDFDEVMSGLVGEGSDININNVELVEKEDEEGNKYTEYEGVGEKVGSKSGDAEGFIKTVAEKNVAKDTKTATMNAAEALDTADTISKEQKSSIFFLGMMENISKMKAGSGNSAKINEAMNLLYETKESSVVDVNTGEIITTNGSMLESPSLYAILAGGRINYNEVENYAAGRVLKTVGNKTGVSTVDTETREGTVTSTNTKVRGSIGRFLPELGASEAANGDILSAVTPTINQSLMNNGYETLGGIYGGEILVEGAVNVGKQLAKASGGAAGDAVAAQNYARLTETILAMDAAADRETRSPFDITSKNTFLGSIVYKLGVIGRNSTSNMSLLRGIGGTIGSVFSGFNNKVIAEDGTVEYMGNYGDCTNINAIGAVGTVGCNEIATFDTSTLNDTFSDVGFSAFVEENTVLENGVRVIRKNSKLADYIKYNNERMTPLGVTDGGILESIKDKTTSVPFVSNIVSMIENFLLASDNDKKIATGESFVNSSKNPEWQTYKYAQRYVALARATSALRQYDGDETAYVGLKFFEGYENPVIAFLNDYYNEIANNI